MKRKIKVPRYTQFERAYRALLILSQDYADQPCDGFPGRVTLERREFGRWVFLWDNLPMWVNNDAGMVLVARAEFGKPIAHFTTKTVRTMILASRGTVRAYDGDAYSTRQPLGLLLPEAWDQQARVICYRVLPLSVTL
ncbi:hypothetical protein D869_gp111 [Caulobacter phage CcrRogue]|uniref:Uncharacterized protein n=1 Tax=Caulobacter phage CcrRogue TaxID=2927986 RepID=K4JSR6_9CAUD|nr:hypothetical protein D869_gp111 [Caulobacter phage CcrRogue]AFU86803.1 hypothetical protein CcrRogue_gp321 [Caulobacter phage CcrRogue]